MTKPDATSETEPFKADKTARILLLSSRADHPVFDVGWTIARTDDLDELHRLWRAESFDLLLAECDSDLDPIAFCRSWRELVSAQEFPIVLMGADGLEAACLENGANDVLSSDCDESLFVARLNHHVRMVGEYRKLKRDAGLREEALVQEHKALEQAEASLRRNHADLVMLDEIVDAVNRETRFDAALDSLLKQGLQLLPRAENGVYLQWDGKRHHYFFAAAHGYDLTDLAKVTLKRGELVKRFTKGTHHLDKGIYAGQDHASPAIRSNTPMPRATLAIEINLKNQQGGFLVWDHPTDPNAFDDQDVRRLVRFRRHARVALERARTFHELESKNSELVEGLQYAAQLQQALLPNPEKLSASFPDHFAIYQPRDRVSTDFYWTHQTDDASYLAVADCSYHSVAGALVSLIGHRLLEYAVLDGVTEPNEILADMQRRINDIMSRNWEGAEHLERMDICLCRFDEYRHEVAFAGARRPLYLLQASTGKSKTIKGDRMFIGGEESDQFANHQVRVEPGDMLYLTTDGFITQKNLQGKRLGLPKLNNLLQKICGLPLEKQKEALMQYWQDYCDSKPQTDNLTILGIRIH